MKTLILSTVLILASTVFGASKQIAQCTVGVLRPVIGFRVNLLQTSDGIYKANLIQGTTVNGTMYRLKKVGDGLFEGTILNNPDFFMRLVISSSPSQNSYIKGYASSLEVKYPDANSFYGASYFKTTSSDEFVCGKKIQSF